MSTSRLVEAAAKGAQSGGPTKVLTVGPPAGRIRELFAKVGAIEAKHGPFSALFVLGDFFEPTPASASLKGKSPETNGSGNGGEVEGEAGDGAGEKTLSQDARDLLDGKITVPISTYIMQGTSSLPNAVQIRIRERAGELCPNVVCMGKEGIYTTAQGLCVAYFGGRWDPSKYAGQEAQEDLSKAEFTSASLSRMLAQPSFASAAPTSSDPAPTTLAAARAAAAAESAAAAPRPPIDLLLTNEWPSGVTLFSQTELPHPTARMWGVPPIAALARAGTPRYHFALAPSPRANAAPIVGLDQADCETGFFWEREPYINELPLQSAPGTEASVTRFVSLARFGNPKKARWFMALNLTPAASSATLPPRPSNSTPSPYLTTQAKGDAKGKKREGAEGAEGLQENGSAEEAGPNFRWAGNPTRGKKQRTDNGGNADERPPPPGYVCRICHSTEHYIRACPQKGVPFSERKMAIPGDSGLPSRPTEQYREPIRQVGPEECWFCLSNPQCAKHLIVSIGEECYVALPKGQLPPSSDPLSPVPGGGHVLIVPIAHFPSLLGVETAIAEPVASEIATYKKALQSTYSAYGAVPVSWEIGRRSGRAGHTQVQVVPVPTHLAGGLEEAFRAAAAAARYTFVEDPQKVLELRGRSEEEKEHGADYFRLDLPGEKTFVIEIKPGKLFNLQFARTTLANYLNVPDRVDWKVCARTEAVEKAEVTAFKEAFQEFAPDF